MTRWIVICSGMNFKFAESCFVQPRRGGGGGFENVCLLSSNPARDKSFFFLEKME